MNGRSRIEHGRFTRTPGAKRLEQRGALEVGRDHVLLVDDCYLSIVHPVAVHPQSRDSPLGEQDISLLDARSLACVLGGAGYGMSSARGLRHGAVLTRLGGWPPAAASRERIAKRCDAGSRRMLRSLDMGEVEAGFLHSWTDAKSTCRMRYSDKDLDYPLARAFSFFDRDRLAQQHLRLLPHGAYADDGGTTISGQLPTGEAITYVVSRETGDIRIVQLATKRFVVQASRPALESKGVLCGFPECPDDRLAATVERTRKLRSGEDQD